jgi:hypothetical protein
VCLPLAHGGAHIGVAADIQAIKSQVWLAKKQSLPGSPTAGDQQLLQSLCRVLQRKRCVASRLPQAWMLRETHMRVVQKR